MAQKTYKVELTCAHIRWFVKPLPEPGEYLYCTSCANEQQVMPVEVQGAEVYDVDGEFTSVPIARGYRGTCQHANCNYQRTGWSWQYLREKMHEHYMREHTRFGSQIQIREGVRLPKGSEAPF